MKYVALVVIFTHIGSFMFAGRSCSAEEKRQLSNIEEHNKSIVLRYIQEVLDGKQFSLMPELFTPDIQMHRPGGELNDLSYIQRAFSNALSQHTIQTTILDIFSSGNHVFVRLSHQMIYSSEHATLRSRIGNFDVAGKSIHWDAMAIFCFSNGKIAEEWVSRDELGMLMQIGKLELKVE